MDKLKAAWAATTYAVRRAIFWVALLWMTLKHSLIFFWQMPKREAFEHAQQSRLWLNMELKATRREPKVSLTQRLIKRVH